VNICSHWRNNKKYNSGKSALGIFGSFKNESWPFSATAARLITTTTTTTTTTIIIIIIIIIIIMLRC